MAKKEKEIKNLTKEIAATIGEQFDNKELMSSYFGKWGKQNPNTAYIIGWCEDLIKEYEVKLANLRLLKSEMTLKNLNGVSADDLKAALAALEGGEGVA